VWADHISQLGEVPGRVLRRRHRSSRETDQLAADPGAMTFFVNLVPPTRFLNVFCSACT
jgi:hypothetical protein